MDLAEIKAGLAGDVLYTPRKTVRELVAEVERLETEAAMREQHQQELVTLCSKKEARAEKAEATVERLEIEVDAARAGRDALDEEVERLRALLQTLRAKLDCLFLQHPRCGSPVCVICEARGGYPPSELIEHPDLPGQTKLGEQ